MISPAERRQWRGVLVCVLAINLLCLAVAAFSLWTEWSALNPAIDFHGVVEDENGDPLPRVRISYGWEWLPLRWDFVRSFSVRREGEIETDEKGRFHITGINGFVLHIRELKRRGYAPRGWNVGEYVFDPGKGGRLMPKPEEVRQFHMVAVDAMEPLVVFETAPALAKRFSFPVDGTPVRWNLWESIPDARGEVSLVYENLVFSHPELSNCVSIDFPGGGLFLRRPSDIARAPESGYTPSVLLGSSHGSDGISRAEYFIQTPDGRYGLLSVEVLPGSLPGTATCKIQSWLNPVRGRRFLEYDPSKRLLPGKVYSVSSRNPGGKFHDL